MVLPSLTHGNLRGLLFDLRVTRWAQGQGYDALYARDPITLLRALATGLPVVFETYRTDINRSRWWGPFRRRAYSRPNLAGVIVHSRVAYQSFRDAGFDEDRLLLAYNGFARNAGGAGLDREAARRALGLAADRPIVGYTGGVGRHKGTDVLADLAAQVPEARFIVVGATRDSDIAPEWTRLENLQILPRVAPAGVAAYLAAADVLIIPPTSRPLEQSGRTVLPIKTFSYLAAGRPILAPNNPDVAEVLSSENALLVAPDDLPAAAAALKRLLGDPALRERLSAAATESARGYSWEARAARVAAFLRRVLPRAAPPD
jgi:glycosyltransferase involved in cell wall biosynthesis